MHPMATRKMRATPKSRTARRAVRVTVMKPKKKG
jgi:hypothetical protein